MSVEKLRCQYKVIVTSGNKKEYPLEFVIDFEDKNVSIVNFNNTLDDADETFDIHGHPVTMEYMGRAIIEASKFATKEIEDYVNKENNTEKSSDSDDRVYPVTAHNATNQ